MIIHIKVKNTHRGQIMKFTCMSIGLFVIHVLVCLAPASADVIAAWHFDETSGSTAFAAAGSVDGSLMGDASFTAGGVNGGAVDMSTSGSGFVDMGNNFSLGGNSTFSVVTWAQFNNGDTNGYIVTGRHQSTIVAGYFLGVNNTGSGSGEVSGGGIFYQAYPNPVSLNLGLNDGGWHQLVGVHDFAGNQTQLYVDGVLRDTEANTSFASSLANFSVGGILNPGGSQMISAMTGRVDEVSIWDQALSPTDVTYLFNNPGALAIPEPASCTLIAGTAMLLFGCFCTKGRKVSQKCPIGENRASTK